MYKPNYKTVQDIAFKELQLLLDDELDETLATEPETLHASRETLESKQNW